MIYNQEKSAATQLAVLHLTFGRAEKLHPPTPRLHPAFLIYLFRSSFFGYFFPFVPI